MGYTARGEGLIIFKDIVSKENKDVIAGVLRNNGPEDTCFEWDDYFDKDILRLTFGGKYDEDIFNQMLVDISATQPVEKGDIRFLGEDGSAWRFVWDKEHWKEQIGRIVYEELYPEQSVDQREPLS